MSGFGGGYDTGGGAGYGGYGGNGGGGGGGGGGFMETGNGGGYGYSAGAGGGGRGGGGGGDAQARGDSLQPVTIKQLHDAQHDAPDDKFVVNGQTLGLVTFVGRIMTCRLQVTLITLTMDDCTGTLNAVYVLDADDNEYSQQKREHIKDLAWVRVVGNLRHVDGAPQLDALRIKGVPDLNELTFHRLEVVRAFLSQTRPRPVISGTTPVRQGLSKVGLGGNGGSVPFSVNGGGGGSGGVGFPGSMAVDAFASDMSPPVAAVFNYLKERHEVGGGEQNVPVSEIVSNVPNVGDEQSVKRIMDSLASDGHVYSTIDEDHYSFCQA